MKEPKPIFIFSLPRSGSTLLQRVIGASDKVSTISEPWFLLPILASYSEVKMYSEFGYSIYKRAFKDLISSYPKGIDGYRLRVRKYAVDVYRDLSNDNAVYFLDKTPRYHLICDELIKIFPNAKFIFLWRKPESIVLSIANTWYAGKWTTYPFEVDLKKGFKHLVNTYLAHKNNSNVISIRYEDLTNPKLTENELQKLGAFLDISNLDFEKKITLTGSLGDVPIDESKRNSRRVDLVNSIYRKKYILNLTNQIAKEDWAELGYNKDELIYDLNNKKVFIPISFLDMYTYCKSQLRKKFIPKSESILY